MAKTKKIPLSGAERSKKFYEKMKAHKTDQQKLKEKLKKRAQRSMKTKEQQNELNLKQRMKRLEKRNDKSTTEPDEDSNELLNPYKSRSAAGKAIAKAKRGFPDNLEYKKYVWQNLGLQFGFLSELEIQRQHRTGSARHIQQSETQHTEKSVRSFYLRRDISYTTPGMSSREHVIIHGENGKETLKKHYLMLFLREAYAAFKTENPELTIGFSRFCDLRPDNVLLLKDTPVEQCLCQRHTNFSFLLEAIEVSYCNDFWENSLCDSSLNSNCWNGACQGCKDGKKIAVSLDLNQKVERKIWKQQEDKRLHRVTETIAVKQVIKEIKACFQDFAMHVNTKRIQFEEFKKDSKSTNLRILNIDFAQNFSAEVQQEVQAGLWSRASVLIFTASVQLNDNDTSYAIVSDSKVKDKRSVFTFLKWLYETFDNSRDPGISEVIWSDGPASEFKNRFMLETLKYLSVKYNKTFSWKFFATSHGKGKCDAIGGISKMTVRKKLGAQGSQMETVNSARDFVRIASANLPNIRFKQIDDDEINDVSKIIDWVKVSPLPGISKMHVFQVSPDKSIKFSKNAVEFK